MDPAAQAKKANITCHYCGETGHKAANCQKYSQSGGGLPGRDFQVILTKLVMNIINISFTLHRTSLEL